MKRTATTIIGFALGGLLATGGEAGAAGAAATSSLSPDAVANGFIAVTYIPDATGIRNITTVAADDSEVRVLTDSTSSMSEAAEWSPGNGRLLFDSDRAGNVHLFSMDTRGGDVQQLTSGDGFEGLPSLSPDGSAIRGPSAHRRRCPASILTRPSPGRHSRRVQPAQGDQVWRLEVGHLRGRYRWLVNADGTEPALLWAPPPGSKLEDADWGPAL